MEVDHFKEMTLEEAMEWVNKTCPINDDIEYI